MKDPTREEILAILSELSEAEPALRFGQLVVNLSYLAREWTNSAIWDVEDDEFLSAAKEHLAARRNALNSSNDPIELAATSFTNFTVSGTPNQLD